MSDRVANPLTLVMTMKSANDYQDVKMLVEGLQQGSGPSPIAQALTAIQTVHFARFVFLDESHLAVITTCGSPGRPQARIGP